jgi:hypothetical protein
MTFRTRRRLLLILIAALLLVGAWYVRNGGWWDAAEAAVAYAIATNTADPGDSAITVRGSTDSLARLGRAADFMVETRSADNMLGGLNPVDPGVYVAHVRAPNGREYHAEAIRSTRTEWRVTLMQQERW